MLSDAPHGLTLDDIAAIHTWLCVRGTAFLLLLLILCVLIVLGVAGGLLVSSQAGKQLRLVQVLPLIREVALPIEMDLPERFLAATWHN